MRPTDTRLRDNQTRGSLRVSSDLCTGCRACEVACVAHHEGVFGRSAARIKALK
jgi:Fe-S-cluster-containing dehydrogenase component